MAQAKQNYYQRLGLEAGASSKAVKIAYRKLVRQFHPDVAGTRGPEAAYAAEQFRLVHEAYQTLINPERKAFYDVQLGVYNAPPVYTSAHAKHRTSTASKTPTPPSSRQKPSPSSSSTSSAATASARPATATASTTKTAAPPPPYKAPPSGTVPPSSSTASKPYSEESLQSSSPSSSKPSTVVSPPTTGGTIEPLNQLQHWFNQLRGVSAKDSKADELSKDGEDLTVVLTLSQEEAKKPCLKKVVLEKMAPCGECAGTGKLGGRVCNACNGTGEKHWSRKLEVQLPGGVKTGSRVRVAGEGHPGLGYGKPGDLYIKLEVLSPSPSPLGEGGSASAATPTAAPEQKQNASPPTPSKGNVSRSMEAPVSAAPVSASPVSSSYEPPKAEAPSFSEEKTGVAPKSSYVEPPVTQAVTSASTGTNTSSSSVSTGAYSAAYVEALQQLCVEGRNVTLNWYLELYSAVLGDTVTVPTFNGPMALVIPAGTQHGQTFRLKGQGLKEENDLPAGDQKVTVLLKVPKVLNVEQKALYEALRNFSS